MVYDMMALTGTLQIFGGMYDSKIGKSLHKKMIQTTVELAPNLLKPKTLPGLVKHY